MRRALVQRPVGSLSKPGLLSIVCNLENLALAFKFTDSRKLAASLHLELRLSVIVQVNVFGWHDCRNPVLIYHLAHGIFQ